MSIEMYRTYEHPHIEKIEELWRSGMRSAAIVRYLDRNNLGLVSQTALSKYGQRHWSDDVEVDTSGDEINSLEDKLREVEELNLGEVQRVSVSKTGYNISILRSSNKDLEEIERLDYTPPVGKIPKLKKKKSTVKTIAIIPDTQVEPGRGTDHLLWISRYLKDNYSGTPLEVVHLGDHWNMGSLSSYDKGKGAMEGRRYVADIESGNRAFEVLDSEIKDEPWVKHFLFGNHEHRVDKAVNQDIQLEGLLTTDHMITPPSWQRHNFLDVMEVDGVSFSHYFYNPNTSKPYGMHVESRLKTIGHSFVMGHQQGLAIGMRYVRGKQQVGVVAGSAYTHDEDYKGPQGNDHWRGIVILENVHEGSFDPRPVSLDTLCKVYEGHPLREHKPKEL